MKRPSSIKAQTTAFKPEHAQGLHDYFAKKLESAKASKASGSIEPVSFPTVLGFAIELGISENTLRGWSRRNPEMRKVIMWCETVREAFAELDLPNLRFDTEVGQ